VTLKFLSVMYFFFCNHVIISINVSYNFQIFNFTKLRKHKVVADFSPHMQWTGNAVPVRCDQATKEIHISGMGLADPPAYREVFDVFNGATSSGWAAFTWLDRDNDDYSKDQFDQMLNGDKKQLLEVKIRGCI
jgi:hypothetical protein